MANNIEKMIATTFMEMAEGLETGSFGKRPKIALTGMGSEHGEANAMEAAVAAAGEQCKESGAKRVVPLKVSGPFHSPMLKEAGEKLGEALAAVTLREIKLPYLANVTADYVREAEAVKPLLKQQVCAPVRWQQSMERLLADGVNTFVEIGPGHTLSGFMKKILKQTEVPADTVQVYNVETMGDFKEYMAK